MQTDLALHRVIGRVEASDPLPAYEPWVRPSDWLALPEVLSTDQKFVGLVFVSPTEGNYISITVQGNYTVDWGDGVTDNVNSNVRAVHEYDYSTIPSNTQLASGDRQVIITVTPQSGQNLTSLSILGVVNNIAFSQKFKDIKMSSPNISTLSFEDGKLYKLESFEYVGVYPRTHIASLFRYCNSLRRVVIDTQNCTSFSQAFQGCSAIQTGDITLNTSNGYIFSYMFSNCRSLIETPNIDTAKATNTVNMFEYCSSLRKAKYYDLSKTINCGAMFSGCVSLEECYTYDTSLATFMNSMFFDCKKLKAIPFFNMASCTNLSGFCSGCESITSIPQFNTSNVVYFDSIFKNCKKLQSVPLLDTSKATTMYYAFSNCENLTTIPLFNTSLVTTMENFLNGCKKLQEIPLYNTTNVTNMARAFAECSVIKTIPNLDTSNVTNMNSIFINCYLLETLPNFNTSKVTDISMFLYNAYSVKEVPAYDLSKVTNFSIPFTLAVSLSRIRATGISKSFSIDYKMIDKDNLVEIFNNIASGVTGQTITITGSYGASSLSAAERAIATDKGWTITG